MNEDEIKRYILDNFQYHKDGTTTRTDRKNSNGSLDKDGYLILKVKQKQFKAHRVAWLLNYGDFPKSELDHINRDRTDNRIENLRTIKKSENPVNCSVYSNNKSGYKGILWLERLQKWQVNVQYKNKNHYIGVFKNIDDAILARKQAEQDVFGKVD